MRYCCRLLFFLLLIFTFSSRWAFAFTSIYCGSNIAGQYRCVSASDNYSDQQAITAAAAKCRSTNLFNCASVGPTDAYTNECKSVMAPLSESTYFSAMGATEMQALGQAGTMCRDPGGSCIVLLTACDATPTKSATAQLNAQIATPETGEHDFDFLSNPDFYRALFIAKVLEDIRTGIAIGIGILLVILLYAKRASIANFVIHGNLPYKLPVYGEDIQCLFKRTQRVNWYGRVVFGIVVNLAMTHRQLGDVRKYWLGRVIAFDSLRRQRQNELARMHLQLAASVRSEAKDKKPLSQLLAVLKAILLAVFYLIGAVFSFLFGFLFIRVTIAKLVRGTIIESKDLVLILQAKDAIEQSTTYLKEYLTTANTFDDGDEIYEPK